jgi:hypothetical protein
MLFEWDDREAKRRSGKFWCVLLFVMLHCLANCCTPTYEKGKQVRVIPIKPGYGLLSFTKRMVISLRALQFCPSFFLNNQSSAIIRNIHTDHAVSFRRILITFIIDDPQKHNLRCEHHPASFSVAHPRRCLPGCSSHVSYLWCVWLFLQFYICFCFCFIYVV